MTALAFLAVAALAYGAAVTCLQAERMPRAYAWLAVVGAFLLLFGATAAAGVFKAVATASLTLLTGDPRGGIT